MKVIESLFEDRGKDRMIILREILQMYRWKFEYFDFSLFYFLLYFDFFFFIHLGIYFFIERNY